MIVADRSLVQKPTKGKYPNIKCLYSTIPRDMRMHMYRVSWYAQLLLEEAEARGIWDPDLPSDIMDYSEEIFQLHDIGRYYVPVDIYNKVEALTEQEKAEIQKHTLYALEAEKSVFFPFFPEHIMPYFRQVAVMHHERLDGKGYPYGKKGDEIPFMARVCAIADAYDGMVSWKSYKEKMASGQAMAILKKEAGRQFQPELVECFLKCKDEIKLMEHKMNME